MRGIWLITEKKQCEYSEGEGDMVNYRKKTNVSIVKVRGIWLTTV